MKISEVSKKYDISPDTLRYYEKEGLLPNVKKNSSGIREYSEMDCNWVEFIKCMRGAGLSIEVLARYIELFNMGDKTREKRKNILIQERAKLIEKRDTIQKTIDRLDFKINSYSETIYKKEKQLLEQG